MVEGINLSNLSVDSRGRVSFSGIGSDIDWESAINNIMAARRIPVDTLEKRITQNDEKIAAYKDLRTLLLGLQDSLSKLRGAVTLDGTGSIFNAKQAFASVSRTDGGTPTAAASLIGVTVTNAAAAGSHTIEIIRTATAHKVGSGAFSSLTDDLGTARGGAAGSIAGSFDINGVTIETYGTDSLQDLRDRINAANTGANATGVTASIVSVGANEHYLILTADKTGTPITIDNEVGGILSGIGISGDGGATFLNELQTAQTAQLYADGLLDPSRYRSGLVASHTAALGDFTSVTGGPHSFEIRDAGGALLKTVSYDDTDTLQSLAAKITDAGAGITASVVQENGRYRLEIAKDDGGAITLGNDTGSLLSDLNVAKKPLLIERASNTINDLFAGVTLSLYQAEPGTQIRLDVEQDLTSVKTAIAKFVDAYNAVKAFINAQNQAPRTASSADETPDGVLRGSRTLANIEASLSRILGAGAAGTNGAYSVLAQIGITFVNNNTIDDPRLEDTLVIDEAKLDEALLNNPSDVRRLFAFEMTSSDPRVTLLGFTGATAYNGDGYTLNLTHDGTSLTGADFNGVAGSATVNGSIIRATDATGAAGLTLHYSGNGDASGIRIDVTIGLGAQLFFELESILDSSTGSIQAEIDTLTDQNDAAEERIDAMLQRLDYQREQLTARFIAMETALATMSSIMDNLRQTVDAWYADKY